MPSRAALITALILDRPLCLSCISARAVATPNEVDASLSAIGQVLTLGRDTDRCRACGTEGPVVWLERPPR